MREVARASGSAAPAASRLLLLPLPLVLALLGGAGHAGGASVCDTANCGMGNCSETAGPIPLPPGYECHCDHGWSNALKLFPFSPCIIPNCSYDKACLNLSLAPPPPHQGIPDICSVVNCGAGGQCKVGGNNTFSYSCECQPGYANLINNVTMLPCVNCYLGDGCYAMGLGGPPPPPAPSGDGGPSVPSAPPPSGSKGSVSSPSLVQLLLLLLLSIATVHLV